VPHRGGTLRFGRLRVLCPSLVCLFPPTVPIDSGAALRSDDTPTAGICDVPCRTCPLDDDNRSATPQSARQRWRLGTGPERRLAGCPVSATFAALGNRTYRLYFTGGAVSNVGSWVQRVAQDWLVLEIGGGAAGLGITTGLQFLPFLLLSPVGGIIADRFPKKRILQTTQVTMGLLAATLGVLTVTGAVTVWEVYVLAFLFGVAGALDAPARQSFVAEMVGKDHLANAIGLNSASFNAARLVGPGLAGLLIVSLGTGLTIVLNAVTYAGTFMALQLMREDQLNTPAKVERTKGMFGDGLRYLRQRPQLLLVLAIAGIVGAFGLNFQMTSALMATEVFGKGAGAYGVLGSILAIGCRGAGSSSCRRWRSASSSCWPV
jgi:MFS family permease